MFCVRCANAHCPVVFSKRPKPTQAEVPNTGYARKIGPEKLSRFIMRERDLKIMRAFKM